MKLLNTFLKYAAGSVFTLLAGLITTPILTRLISTGEMGKYSMFITLGGLIASILYFGLDQSYVRFYNEEEEDRRTALMRKCLQLPILGTAVCFVLLLLLSGRVSQLIIGEQSLPAIICFAVYLFGSVVDRFWLLKIRMAQKAIAYSALNVLRKLSYLVMAVAAYYFFLGDNCWSLIFPVTLAEVVVLVGARIVERGNWTAGGRTIRTPTKELIRYGFPFIFTTTITALFHSTDKLMLNALSTYQEIGLYTGAQNIVNILSQVQTVFTTFWVPVAYEHYAKAPEDKEFYIKANKIISYAMLIIALLLLCTKDIVVLFLGKKYKDAVYIFPFLAFMPIMYTVSESTVMGINFMKRSSYHVWISVVCVCANAVGNYFLITAFGAKGAAISTGLSYVLFFILRTFLANKVYPVKFSIGRFMISCAMVYALAIVASFKRTSVSFLVLAFGVGLVISILYIDVIKMGFELLREQITKKKNENS